MSKSKCILLGAMVMGMGSLAQAQLAPQSEICSPSESSPQVWENVWPMMSSQVTNEGDANNGQIFCSDDGSISAKFGPGPMTRIGSLRGYYANHWVPAKSGMPGHYNTNVLVEITLFPPFAQQANPALPPGMNLTYPTNYVINNHISQGKPCRVDVSQNGGVLQYNTSFVMAPNIDGDTNLTGPNGSIYNIDIFNYGPVVNGLVNSISFFNLQNFDVTAPVGALPFPNLQEIYYKRVPASECAVLQQYKNIFPITIK